MDTQRPHRQTPKLQFRSETTKSPIIYQGNEMVPSSQRSEQNIDDEFVFLSHQGYIFHDSRGIESGSTKELQIVQEEQRLQDRLHAIWFELSSLDLRYIKDICPDKIGASLRTFVTVFNTTVSKSLSSLCLPIRPVPPKCPNTFRGFRKSR
ncbi:hypothetical protein EDB86DRAFT_2934225 [Lactarius hatsudake]|nr:hypothetical protein EDB86DRAFT_2934225 [Lactarius hatsudake]